MRQVETSRTIVFDAPRRARGFFEALVADKLDLGRPDRVEVIFAGRPRRRGRPPAQEPTYKTRIDTRDTIGATVNADYKHSRIKQYRKDGRALRIATVINNLGDLICKRRLQHLMNCRPKARVVNARLLDTERVGHHSRRTVGDEPAPPGSRHHVLIRRNDTTGGLAYHCCYSPQPRGAWPSSFGSPVNADGWRNPSNPRRDSPAWTTSTALDVLAPLNHPRHARPRLPGRGHRRGTRLQPRPGRTDRPDRQRVPPPIRRPPTRRRTHHQHSACLVPMASTTSTPTLRESQPMPGTMIANYRCSTRDGRSELLRIFYGI